MDKNKKEKWSKFYDDNISAEEEGKVQLVKSVIKNGLFHPNRSIDFYKYEKIYIDLDSLLSLALKVDLPLDELLKHDLSSYILELFQQFFYFYDTNSQIYIVYSFNPNNSFTKIYPNWCKERYDRYGNVDIMKFIKNNLLRRIKKFSDVVKNVELVKSKDAPILSILASFEFNVDNRKSIVLSRDPHYQCLWAYHEFNIYNGKNIINRKTSLKDKDTPNLHYSLYPHYYLISGMKRNEYTGLNKWGPKRTADYITKNKASIISFEDKVFDTIKEYKDLFFLENILFKEDDKNE